MQQFLLERLTEISDALADLKSSVAVNQTLHKNNTDSLDTHIKRTNLLEEKVDTLRKNQAWWSITGKVILIVLPLIAIVLKFMEIF